MSFLTYTWIVVGLTLTAAAVQAVIVVVLIRRKSRSEFPVFFAYNAFAVVAGMILAISYVAFWRFFLSDDAYRYLYFFLNMLTMALEFGVMYELMVIALKPYSAIIDLGKMLFRWAGLFLLVAAGLTAFATAGSLGNQCSAGAELLSKSLRLMECGMLFLFFLFERRLSLSWRSRPVSLALGLGISAAVALICSYLRTRYVTWMIPMNLIEVGTYLSVVVFWATRFAAHGSPRKSVLDSPSRLIFQRWDEALAGYGYGASAPSAVESFLPGIEKTVDRVMARRVIQ